VDTLPAVVALGVMLVLVAAAGGASAMMDISDGLLKDARRLARASGVTLDLQSDSFTADVEALEPAVTVLGREREDALSWVITGGEDHGLLATFPAGEELPEDFRIVGVVGEPGDEPVVIDGEPPTLKDSGWDHFDRR